MNISKSTLQLTLSLLIIAFASVSVNSVSRAAEEKDSERDFFTPVLVSVLEAPNPVLGSDGKYHLVYELTVVNVSGMTWEIESVDVRDSAGKSLHKLTKDDLDNRTELLKDKSKTSTLPAGEAGMIFVHFSVPDAAGIPQAISHMISITVPGGIPAGFLHFMELPEDSASITYSSESTATGPADAVVIGPPLEGGGWIAADGCCDAVRHIRAVMPINDRLRVTQRFAIDWEKMNGEKRIYSGDPKDVTSYFAYGQKALAVKDAAVVRAVDKYKDQVPGALPPGMTLAEADGNHVVLDLGDGKYALYAHFKPGSVAVKVGDTVKRGQLLGIVGNTGNSSAPHLHFHVMDGPSTFSSNGLPYVIDEFDLIEKVPSTEAFDKAEADGTPAEVVPVDKPGIHKNELPLDQSVVSFP